MRFFVRAAAPWTLRFFQYSFRLRACISSSWVYPVFSLHSLVNLAFSGGVRRHLSAFSTYSSGVFDSSRSFADFFMLLNILFCSLHCKDLHCIQSRRNAIDSHPFLRSLTGRRENPSGFARRMRSIMVASEAKMTLPPRLSEWRT